MTGGGWIDWKTRADAERTLRLRCELMGDGPTDRITRHAAPDFRDLLRRVPALNGKSIYQGRTVKQAIALADDIRRQL